MSQRPHISVLLHEALECLDIEASDVVVDLTLGDGGHSRAIAERLGKKGMLIGIDADSGAVKHAREALAGVEPRVELLHGNFRNVEALLSDIGVHSITKCLYDLGLRTGELEGSGRGFSFLSDEPLMMTFNDVPKAGEVLARDIVNTWKEETLATIIFGYGEERFANRIARRIVDERERSPIETTTQLAEIVRSALPPHARHGRIHPATKTFQALRMAVNSELQAIEESLPQAFELLESGGRMAVISFHSHEDRIVKRFFKQEQSRSAGDVLTKKPIVPTKEEVAKNPRSRSAKLRAIKKL